MPNDNRRIYEKPGHLIRRLQQISVAIFMDQTAKFDITPVQYSAVLAVQIHPGIDQTTLCNIIAFDRSTIGDVVARLEAKQLIKRVPGLIDRRTKLLYITPSGRRLIRNIESAVQSAQRLIMAPLRPNERNSFMQMLRRLVHINNEHSRAPLRPKNARPRRHSPSARLAKAGRKLSAPTRARSRKDALAD